MLHIEQQYIILVKLFYHYCASTGFKHELMMLSYSRVHNSHPFADFSTKMLSEYVINKVTRI